MAGVISQINDHAAQALATMSTWTHDKARLRKLAEIVADQVQLFEDVCFDVINNSQLSAAGCTGVILDEYGKVFNLLRGSLSDASYKSVLQLIVAAYQSNGTVREIQNLASDLIGEAVRYTQYSPAHYRLEYIPTASVAGDWRATVVRILEIVRPAGVSYDLIEGTQTGSGTFMLDVGPGFDQGRLAEEIV